MRYAKVWLLVLAVALPWAARAGAAPAASAAPGAAADAAASTPASPAAPIVVATIDGAIGPATADHVHRALTWAAARRAQLVVLQIDTPGGLDAAMRSIIKDILASPVAVAGFVAPNGARAASAGTYILYASHVAAMAPATNLGAATPVAIGLPGAAPPPGSAPLQRAPAGASRAPAAAASAASAASPEPHGDAMAAKRVADASAYIRSLAQLRGRNAEWAEQAVRESVSLSAREALGGKVIDLIAGDVPDLLRQLDGRELALATGSVRLATAGAPVRVFEADWRSQVLSVLADPSLALVLMLAGIYGLLFEFSNPGFVLPGVVGGICLLLALFALQMLPVNYAGLALILLGIAFLVAEVFVPSFGALGIGGVVALAAGALLLFDGDAPGSGVPLALVVATTATSALFVLGVVGMAVRARRRPLASGVSTLLGSSGELLEFADGQGWATVQGERWRVHGARDLPRGARVRVVGVHGLTLEITAAPPDAVQGA